MELRQRRRNMCILMTIMYLKIWRVNYDDDGDGEK
jgi:hypothetical protein